MNKGKQSALPRIIVSVVLLALLFVGLLALSNYLEERRMSQVDANPPMPAEGLTPAEVVWVSDGDTIICKVKTSDLPEDLREILLAGGADADVQTEGETSDADAVPADESATDSAASPADADSLEITVRLIGLDAPESVHPDPAMNTEEGRLASEFVRNKLQGQRVNLEFDEQYIDKYSRVLAYVWFEGALFNKEILAEGHAELLNIPPNTKYEDVFVKALESA